MFAKRKAFLLAGLLILTICLCACSEIATTGGDLPDYTALDQLPEGYGVDDAIADSCVVVVESELVSGGDVWETFLKKTEKGQSCRVRIARYYGEENFFDLQDLSFDGSSYHVNTAEGVSEDYRYLKHYEVNIKSSDSDKSVLNSYILVNQEDITYHDIEQFLASSIAVEGEGIDFYMVTFHGVGK